MTRPPPVSWGPGRGRNRGNRGGYPNYNDRGFNNVHSFNETNGRGYNQNSDRSFNQNSDRGSSHNSDRGYNQNNIPSYIQTNDICYNQNRYNNSNQVYVPSHLTRGQRQPTNHTGHHLSFVVPQENVVYPPNVNTTLPPPPLLPPNGVPVLQFPFARMPPNHEPGRFIPTNERVLLHMPNHVIQQNGQLAPLQVPMEVPPYPTVGLQSYEPINVEKLCLCDQCNCMNISAYIMINDLIAEKKNVEYLLKSLQDEQQNNVGLGVNAENEAPFPEAKEGSFRLSADAVPFVESERYEPAKRWSSGVDVEPEVKTEVNTLYEPTVYYNSSDCQIVDSRDCEIVDSSHCEIVDLTSEHSVPVVSWADEEDATPVVDGNEERDPTQMADVVKDVEGLSVSDQPAGGQRGGGVANRDRGGNQGNQTRGPGRQYSEQQGGRQKGYQNRNNAPQSNSSGRGGGGYNNGNRGGNGGGGRRNQGDSGRSDNADWRARDGAASSTDQSRGGSGREEKSEGEYQSSEDQQHGGGGGVVITEVNGDLFDAPPDWSLAHCVAADLRMGSGIAVGFRSKFGRIGELLDQYKEVGEVAILDDAGRYLYYLITKELSRGKPTMGTLRKSLEAMRRHCVAHHVTKLAIPRIGCGLDRLEWRDVKSMLLEIFAGTGLAITVYNFPQADDERDVDAAPKKKAALYITHHKQSLVTIESKTGLIYFCSEETADNPTSTSLDDKHRFLQLVRSAPRALGKIVRTERGSEVFYGFVVKRRERDPVSYLALVDCVKQFRKTNDADGFEYLGIEAFRDGKDRLATEKVVTVLRNMLSIIRYRLEVWICWPEAIQGDHDWSLDVPAGGGGAK